MDPLTLSGAFATVVGLLANFKAERSSAELSDFMSWLRDQHQEKYAFAIAQNDELSLELSRLLATNHEELLTRLSALNAQISNVASQVEGFAGIARILSPKPSLSEQAKSVLRQVVESGAKFVMEHKLSTGQPTDFLFIEGAVGQVRYSEPQFINEDLEVLVAMNFLRLELTSKGGRKFSATRAAIEYVRADQEPAARL